LVLALVELLRPTRVGIHLLLRDGYEQRWLPVVGIEQGGAPELHDAMQVDFRRLPLVSAASPRGRSLEAGLPVVAQGAGNTPGCLTELPLFAGAEPEEASALEIGSTARLDAHSLECIERVLRVYAICMPCSLTTSVTRSPVCLTASPLSRTLQVPAREGAASRAPGPTGRT
jgi:hypothetical protein